MSSTSVCRPGGITAMCILTIVLGLLGLLNDVTAVAGPRFQGQIPSALVGLQADAARRQHVVRDWVAAVIRLNVAIALFLGGIWSLGLKPIGRITLLAAFGVGILLELFQLWPSWEARALLPQTLERVIQGPVAQALAEMLAMMIVATFLAKSGFYGFGLWYLTRPRIANLFVRPKPADPQWA